MLDRNLVRCRHLGALANAAVSKSLLTWLNGPLSQKPATFQPGQAGCTEVDLLIDFCKTSLSENFRLISEYLESFSASGATTLPAVLPNSYFYWPLRLSISRYTSLGTGKLALPVSTAL